MSEYKYFCDSCGWKFNENPPKRLYKLDNGKEWLDESLYCPHCGSYAVYEDTEENARASVRRLTEYENTLALWEEDG